MDVEFDHAERAALIELPTETIERDRFQLVSRIRALNRFSP